MKRKHWSFSSHFTLPVTTTFYVCELEWSVCGFILFSKQNCCSKTECWSMKDQRGVKLLTVTEVFAIDDRMYRFNIFPQKKKTVTIKHAYLEMRWSPRIGYFGISNRRNIGLMACHLRVILFLSILTLRRITVIHSANILIFYIRISHSSLAFENDITCGRWSVYFLHFSQHTNPYHYRFLTISEPTAKQCPLPIHHTHSFLHLK